MLLTQETNRQRDIFVAKDPSAAGPLVKYFHDVDHTPEEGTKNGEDKIFTKEEYPLFLHLRATVVAEVWRTWRVLNMILVVLEV